MITRSGGILMPISSLPSPYGIGTFGKAAYDYADFLAACGLTYWQVLPLGQTSYGDSPYQSFSSFAGNPYFIDLDMLVEEGLLNKSDLEGINWGTNPRYVDYGKIWESRYKVLAIAKQRGWDANIDDINRFRGENHRWIEEYALYMACKKHFGMKSWIEWEDEEIRLHHHDAVCRYREELREDIELFVFIQYLFFKQWTKLKKYINDLGLKIIGDIPIYVALDSADVWSEPDKFRLNSENIPVEVAGVPPDYFSEDGQLWGNPLYNYDRMREDGFEWWIRRIGGAEKLYDVIRIDHFRGFASYWAVPYDAETAKTGRWVQGPGIALVGVITSWFHWLDFIAEDLGVITPEVSELLEASKLPGMKVLEFAFDSKEPSNYLPHVYPENCVCYTGTHDNSPLLMWKDEAAPEDIEFATRYLGLNQAEGFNYGIIRGGMGSVAKLFIAQMQDYLNLGLGHRMNLPGTAVGNWQWRMLPGEASAELAARIHEMLRMYGRLNPVIVAKEQEAARIAAEEAANKAAEEAAAAADAETASDTDK